MDRIVLLGASNLQMGWRGLLGEALSRVGAPAEVLVAAGHGRSYGAWSRVLWRGLPGIVGCGLWPAVDESGGGAGYALLTDIGNDLAYGSDPRTVAAWVTTCVERLRQRDMRVVVTLFPEESVARLGGLRFWMARSLLFPARRFSLGEMIESGRELNLRLCETAERTGCAICAPEVGWFGADAIHHRAHARATAWSAMLAGWGTPPRAGVGAQQWRVAGRPRPELYTIAGRERRAAQPSARLAGGGSVSFF